MKWDNTDYLLLQGQVDFIDFRVRGSHDKDIIGHDELQDRDIEIQLCSFDFKHVKWSITKTGCEETIVVGVVGVVVAGTGSTVSDGVG